MNDPIQDLAQNIAEVHDVCQKVTSNEVWDELNRSPYLAHNWPWRCSGPRRAMLAGRVEDMKPFAVQFDNPATNAAAVFTRGRGADIVMQSMEISAFENHSEVLGSNP